MTLAYNLLEDWPQATSIVTGLPNNEGAPSSDLHLTARVRPGQTRVASPLPGVPP